MAGAMLLLNGSQTIRANTDLLLVGQFLQPAELGVYTAVVRTATLVAFILSVASLVAQPTIAALHAKDELYELRKFIRHVTRSIFVASLAVGVGVVVFGEFVLALFGNEFVSGYKSLIILVTGHVLSALFGPMTSLLVMTDKQYYAATLHMLSILLTIVLNLVLIPRFGIEGAAAATAVSLFLTNVGLAFAARRLFDFSR
jgi:O-antigen/teichoic acid export membrane protein